MVQNIGAPAQLAQRIILTILLNCDGHVQLTNCFYLQEIFMFILIIFQTVGIRLITKPLVYIPHVNLQPMRSTLTARYEWGMHGKSALTI